MKVALIVATTVLASQALAQTAPSPEAKEPWAFHLTIDGYVLSDQDGYASPTLTADRDWLHLEVRYNYENLRTGSVWLGYNFTAGTNLVLDVTPIIGGVFGRTTGIAPGCEAALSYKRWELSISNEYVFDTSDKAGNYYYAWPQLTYSPLEWLRVGAVAQHTKAYHTKFNVQRGFMAGVSHKRVDFTTYIFDVGTSSTTAVLGVAYRF